MISRLHESFGRDYARPPAQVQEQTKVAYRKFMGDPGHPSLRFKCVHPSEPLWSARVNDSYRVVGVRIDEEEIVWVFVGTHAQYDRFIGNY